MIRLQTLIPLFLLLLLAAPLSAEERTIKVLGRSEITVSTGEVALGDLAHVSSSKVRDEDAIVALKRVVIARSPEPGKEDSIPAARILEKLREAGVNLKEVGYAFPRMIKVKRASRPLSLQEVRTAIDRALLEAEKQLELVRIKYDEPLEVAPGVTEIAAKIFPGKRAGERTAALTITSGEKNVQNRNLTFYVREWAEVPVASRQLPRGSVVGKGDIMMARLNLAEIPIDTEQDLTGIVGLETSRNISYGEVFRKNKLAIPPVIEAGSAVTIMYRSQFLEATASGIALEDGLLGEKIRVRNDQSRKILTGTVETSGIVKVSP